MRISVSSIGACLFFLFIGNSVYNLISIFRSPKCSKGDVCYESFLNSKPELDLFIFLSDNSKYGSHGLLEKVNKFDYNKPWEKEIAIDVPKNVRNNGSLIIHVLLLPSGKYHREKSLNELINIPNASYMKKRLTKHAIPISASFNLLAEEKSKRSEKAVPHLRSKFSIVLCNEELNIPHTKVPGELYKYLRINNRGQFLPVLDQDIMQMRLRDLVQITPETSKMSFLFSYNPISFGKFRFLVQVEMTLHQFIALGFTDRDLDEVKGVFADTNLYLLIATVFITSVHLLLDFLAFKNDISFWKNQTSTAGLSSRAILWRAFSQSIIFMYLLDEGTSLLVLIPSGIAVLIELWKVSKVLKTSFSWRSFKFIRDTEETKEETETRLYDEECMRYLSFILYPLCLGAAIYSLIYHPHKSWYSWIINSLANGVYAFGFLFMLPQLFINYRLKSVAALPWRAFTYRAFNTFIDDVFAFIITMPTAHRVACFRDDIVFFIYLYQRWLYPVDKSRIDDIIPVDEDVSEKKDK